MKNEIIKTFVKALTSGELIAAFDKNNDGKVSLEEIKNAPFSVWLDLIIKYGLIIYAIYTGTDLL